LEFIENILLWNETPIEGCFVFDLDKLHGFPSLNTKHTLDTLYHFMLHCDYDPARLKAYSLYNQIRSKIRGFEYSKNEKKSMEKNSLYLLNSMYPSHVEAGVLAKRLLSGDGNIFRLMWFAPKFILIRFL
jgi:hypothetical protein